jgi:hypothetical protein
MRAFHIHPVAFKVRADTPDFLIPFRTTLDEEFVARLSRHSAKIYVSRTSDEMGVCSLMELHERNFFSNPLRPLTPTTVAIFGEAHAGLIHRELALRSVRLQYADGKEGEWREAERKATQFMNEVMLQLNTPDSVIELESPRSFEARKRRQKTYGHWSRNEGIIELISMLFPGIGRRVVIHLYLKRIFLFIIALMHKTKLVKVMCGGTPPLLPTRTSTRIRQIVSDAGRPSWRSNDNRLEEELIRRLQNRVGFRDFLFALMGRGHRQRDEQ